MGIAYIVSLFVSVFFLGEIVVIPALYLSLLGYLNFTSVFIVAVSAPIVYEHIWFAIGRIIPRRKIYDLPFIEYIRPNMDRLENFFSCHGSRCVFYSKFVLGTRTATVLLAGIHDMSLVSFSKANISANIVWTSLLTLGAYLVKSGAMILTENLMYIRIGISFFILLFIVFMWVVKRLFRKEVLTSKKCG